MQRTSIRGRPSPETNASGSGSSTPVSYLSCMIVQHRKPTWYLAGGRIASPQAGRGWKDRQEHLPVYRSHFLDLESGLARKYDLITAAVLETGNSNDDTPRTLGTYASNVLSAEMKDLLVMAR